jgi:hypothetical protein
MSLGADILLKIRSTFENKSVEEAKKKTEELGKATNKAGNDASSGMNVMAAATALMQGNVNGAIGAIAPLIEKLKVLKMSLTQITLVGALIGSLVKLFTSIRERAAQAVEALEKFRAESFEREVARIEAAHAKWDAANQKSLAIREAAHQFFLAEYDAYKQEALAVNELAKQKELANAASEDERKIIENKYKGRAGDISSAYDMKVSEQEKKRLEQKARDDEAKIAENEKRIASQRDLSKKRFLDAGDYTQRANQASLGWGGVSFSGGSTQTDGMIDKADKAREESKRLLQESEKLRIENEQLKISAEQSRKLAKIQEVKTRTIGISRESSDIATTSESASIQKAIEDKQYKDILSSQLEDRERQQSSAEERFKPLIESATRRKDIQGREATEAVKVAESYRSKGDSKGYADALQVVAREQAEADAAAVALKNLGQQMVDTVRVIKVSADALREQMKRIGA